MPSPFEESFNNFDPFYRPPGSSVDPRFGAPPVKQEDPTLPSQLGGILASGTSKLPQFGGLPAFLSGSGMLTLQDQTGSFNLGPGGAFNLQKLRVVDDQTGEVKPTGFRAYGNPMNQSLGAEFPVEVFGSKGTIGLEGSFNKYAPYAGLRFKFPDPAILDKQPARVSEVQAVSNALDSAGFKQNQEAPSETAREFLDKKIEQYRSSGGRDPNSPSSWF